MELNAESCYRALRSRDARFDGRFFTGVVTTGIYCRPICPARTPLRKNVRFFACAAAAQAAGFRACRRCRPETAPGTPPWLGTSATVARALRFIERGALADGDLSELAGKLGIGDRQLRRLFTEQLGTSPKAVENSRRVRQAKLLLESTSLPMGDVAQASGFGSLRQFNDAVRKAFKRTPSLLRAAAKSRPGTLTVRLAFRPPFEWESLLGFLALRAIPGVESVSSEKYARTFRHAGGGGGMLEVHRGDGNWLALTLPSTATSELLELIRRVRRLFDLDADPLAIASCLRGDPALARQVTRRPGLRVPGGWDVFEIAVRAILGQQISVRAATSLAGRLVRTLGVPFEGGNGLTHLFPEPEVIAKADPALFGLPKRRAEALRAVADALARRPELSEPSASLEELDTRLRSLPGVGPWTAQYLAMRAFEEPDAFPSGDLGLLRAAGVASPAELEMRAERWRPWRAYAAMQLWTQ